MQLYNLGANIWSPWQVAVRCNRPVVPLGGEVFEVPNDLEWKDPEHLYLKEESQPVQTNGGEEENLRDEEAEDEEVENEAAAESEVQEEENDAPEEEDLDTQGQNGHKLLAMSTKRKESGCCFFCYIS